MDRAGIREHFFLHRLVPQVLAFIYYQISWLLFVIRPSLSYALNAAFEDHAEQEYMRYASEHPELENQAFDSAFKADFGDFETMLDVVRQIGYDERVHKLENLKNTTHARYS